MKTLIFDGIFVNYDLPDIFENKNSLEILFKNAKSDNFDRFILIQNGKIKKIPDGIKNAVINDYSPQNILNTILNESKNSEEIMIINAGSPFYDKSFINKMFEHHNKYFADYTYCLGYPDGLTPCLLRKSIIKEMAALVQDDKTVTKDYLFYSISKDINAFDIETFLSDFDLRINKISVGNNDKGEEILTKKLFDKFSSDHNFIEINNYLKNNIQELYTIPYLVVFELTNYSNISSLYYPCVKREDKFLNIDSIKNIFNDLIKLNENINIILGGIGDPLYHPDFINILKYLTQFNNQIIIETFGQNINTDLLNQLDLINKKNVVFVIKLDAYEEKTYKVIHPEGDFNKAKSSVQLLIDKGFKTYKQIIRMIENEIEIENYIKNKDSDNLIIRKFSTFCDMMVDKKVVDLSPIDRIPCFHLRREIYIKADGTVPACSYSIYKDVIGDINKENINSILNKLKELYKKNAQNDYLDYCINCNDYYLFNF